MADLNAHRQAEPSGNQDAMMAILQDIQTRIQGVENRMDGLENASVDSNDESQSQEDQTTPQATTEHTAQATPNSLRANPNTMAEVAARLAEWGFQDEEEDGQGRTPAAWGARSRKSGTVTTGTDNIKLVIDWPHFHLRKGPKRVTPEFEQLSSEEFVLGYLRMLADPNSKFDTPRMLEILHDIMEDAVDFGWDKARSFYGAVGLDVEHKRLTWNSRQELLKLRLTHARTPTPQATPKQPKTNNVSKLKSCASYQTGTCDQSADHGGFRHICDYCLRVRNMAFPHPEEECKTKRHNQTKNA